MIERIQQHFILSNYQLKLYALATLTGLLTGISIIIFRLIVSEVQLQCLPSGIQGYISKILEDAGILGIY